MSGDYYNKWKKIEEGLMSCSFRQYFCNRDIWYCYLGKNIGDEENGNMEMDYIRPVIIIRKYNSNIFLAVPLTRTIKDSQYYFKFSFQIDKYSCAILSQQRTLDSIRLIDKIGFINKSDYRILTERLKGLIP